MTPGTVRQRLQLRRPLVVAVDALAVLLSAASFAAVAIAMQADSESPFVVAQIVGAAAVGADLFALVLAAARVERTRLDLVTIPVASLLLVVTVATGWALCWAAGLGGDRCWWETLGR